MDIKLKTEFLLNGPDVSPIYFDFLSGPFDQKTIPLSDETFLSFFIISTIHYWPQLLNNLGLFPLLTIKKSKNYETVKCHVCLKTTLKFYNFLIFLIVKRGKKFKILLSN